ncbi:RsbR, positive regulator of sigma-B [Jeotgalibacillus sp. S-D1]|uniref:STAS domain-containing protein n=1 Tax=Jeotgalibacillus sp. S-D1 TaxID=2552189 RepID=UPI00105A1310|nr:STAS domain-containing protein [Jeotgalibacillus sp. S-D1]TDL30851.1 RsbR, positive regulator of sigma-B [Jeotgalibacillus sp. S-D1]
MNGDAILPEGISPLYALNSIGETILIAYASYTIVWMNAQAKELLSVVAPLYGLKNSDELIGLNMNHFHRRPEYQEKLMGGLSEMHRSRITIRDRFVADIVITPIRQEQGPIDGYVVMLMDVTTKAEEEDKKEKFINALSTPVLRVWSNAIALPLIGEFDIERFDQLIMNILVKCSSEQVEYVLLNLSEVYIGESNLTGLFQKLIDCISLIGSQCILVGIPPSLATSLTGLDRDILTFSTTYDGLQYIIQNEK